MMITRYFFSVLLLTLAVFSFFTAHFFILQRSDFENYDRLMKQKEKRKETKLEKTTYQLRQGVQKDLFLKEAEDRLHFRIKSENSKILLRKEGTKTSLIEKLYNIEGCFQDKINHEEKRQQIRYFKANKGTYLFPSHCFFTDSIYLSFFDLEGNALPQSIDKKETYLQGHAQKFSFSFSEKSPHFNAYHFKANLIPEKIFK